MSDTGIRQNLLNTNNFFSVLTTGCTMPVC